MVKTDILSHFKLTNYTWVPAALLSILNIILSEFMVNFSLKKTVNVAINNHKKNNISYSSILPACKINIDIC